MKKIFIIFALLLIFNSARAQLEFYEFMFNIYDNGERIIDSRKFQIKINSFERENPGTLFTSKEIFPSDTSQNLGYDYRYIATGGLLFEFIVEINIIQSVDTMKIIVDNPKSSAWASMGIDKLEFKKGTFKLTESEWPKNRRDRPMNNRYFPFIDENFDWEKIRVK
jgi:hypothetical protein